MQCITHSAHTIYPVTIEYVLYYQTASHISTYEHDNLQTVDVDEATNITSNKT